MTARLTPEDLGHAALVDAIATTIDDALVEHTYTVHGSVLSTLLARFVLGFPPELRASIVAEHFKGAQGFLELLELQAANRQAN